MSTTVSSSRPRMDPRIGRRRAAVARARGRRRLRFLLVLLGVALLGVGTLVVLHSRLLAARHVLVRGARHTTPAAVRRAAGVAGHPPLIDVSPTSAAARVEALPWVASAQVRRKWPDTVVISLTERVPVAVVPRAGGGVAVVDRSGRVLEWAPLAPAGLPTVLAPARVGVPGSWLGHGASAALEAASAADAVLGGRLQEVLAVSGGQLELRLSGGIEAQLGNTTALAAKLAALASVLAGAAPAGPAVIDVRAPAEPTEAPVAASG